MVYPLEEITDRLLAADAEHSSTRLRSAEDDALDELPDTEIKAAMQALPEQFRRVVYYADVADLKYSEIAEIMHIPQGTVMSDCTADDGNCASCWATSPNTQPLPRQGETMSARW